VTVTVNESRSTRWVGIDLGTTNSALAWTGARRGISLLNVTQLGAPGEPVSPPTLPSFLYLATDAEVSGKTFDLPWDKKNAARKDIDVAIAGAAERGTNLTAHRGAA